MRSGVPKFVFERRKSHIPLSTYFASVDYKGEGDDAGAEEIVVEHEEEEEDADDESDTRSVSSSPASKKKASPQWHTPPLPIKDDSATGEIP